MRYNASEFDAYLIELPDVADTTPTLQWAYDLHPGAEPPADKFLLLQEIDTGFRLSWLHLRKDLQDQSASSYDLSLATRAFAANWSAQEVVNLLLAHRRKHGEDLKLRKDYYDRTLDRAMSGKDQESRKQLLDDLKAGKPLPETVSKDPAEIMAMLTGILGVSLTKLVRYRGETNTYHLGVNGRTIPVPAIEDFDSQTRFRRLLLDHTDIRIPTFKADKWHEILSRLLQAVENVDVASGTNKGAFENWIELYLSDGIEKEDNWQKAAIDYRPFKLNGATYLVSEGFKRFLVSQMQERISSQDLHMRLTQLGLQFEKINVKNHKGARTRRGVWKIQDLHNASLMSQ